MTRPLQTLATALALAGLVRRRGIATCRAFGGYLACTLTTALLIVLWPGGFYTHFRMAKSPHGS